ncbi:DeoR family transcriptional regulator [Kineococcus sp. NUM-3379]
MARGPVVRAAPATPGGLALAATTARRFYVDGLTKVEIARQLGISRFKVARLLAAATASGLVRIEISAPPSVDGELSEQLRSRFGLTAAFAVVPDREGTEAAREAVARFTAGLLEELAGPDDVVGVAGGRTPAVMSAHLRADLRCRFVQLGGALAHPDLRLTAVDVVQRVAEATAGSAVTFYAPFLVPDAATAEGLRAQPQIAGALAEHDHLTRAVVSVGYWAAGESTAYDVLDAADREFLAAAGACAELTGLVLDRDGNPVRPLDDRVIGVRLEQLRRADVVAMASGLGRAEGTAAALRSGLVCTLVTPVAHARGVLGLPGP